MGWEVTKSSVTFIAFGVILKSIVVYWMDTHNYHTWHHIISIANKYHVYSPLQGTVTGYITMHTCRYTPTLRFMKSSKYTYKHQPVLSSIRQETLQYCALNNSKDSKPLSGHISRGRKAMEWSMGVLPVTGHSI